ncbi:poly(3-hydroxybutyrate) depolymerase [Kwoniella heveanensis CBS 569]|nr:poly(3-hydroxybutyrate) depolymerase [Kwoniella heveanensis CBS 569]
MFSFLSPKAARGTGITIALVGLVSLLATSASPLASPVAKPDVNVDTIAETKLQRGDQLVFGSSSSSSRIESDIDVEPQLDLLGNNEDDIHHEAIVYGHINRTLSGREYVLNVPEGYVHGVQHPVVLSFHGAGGNSTRQEILSQLSLPDLRIAGLPFLSAFPQGVNNTDWNMTHIWQAAVYGNKTVDDIQFVKDILSDISSNYTVNPRRYYASGKSNGGGFTALLACRPDTSALFAAFAPVSPALYQEAKAFHDCHPARGRAVPIFHSHGIEDDDTPFHGRTKESNWIYGPEPDVRDWRARWALRNGHPAPPEGGLPKPNKVYHPHINATEEVWDLGKAEIRALSVRGLGHSWPTTEGLDLAGRPNQTATFNFTGQHLVQFFSRHQLPEEFLP